MEQIVEQNAKFIYIRNAIIKSFVIAGGNIKCILVPEMIGFRLLCSKAVISHKNNHHGFLVLIRMLFTIFFITSFVYGRYSR
jgi:hypothetical protein